MPSVESGEAYGAYADQRYFADDDPISDEALDRIEKKLNGLVEAFKKLREDVDKHF